MHITLRTKGMLALVTLILYVALFGLFAAHERQNLVVLVQKIDDYQSRQSYLTAVFNTLTNSIVDIQTVLGTPDYADSNYHSYRQFAEHLELLGANLTKVRQVYPLLATNIDNFEKVTTSLMEVPDARHLADVRDSEQKLVVKLQDILAALQARSNELTEKYHDTQQYINYVAIAANVTGAVVSAIVILFFFTHLANNIKQLEDRAMAVVLGYSGPPLENKRHDEVGSLIDAVNSMQYTLRRYEHQQELSRQQRFHQEKMAAVGSLAAAVSHEVSNPLASISGVVQYMIEETRDDNRKISKQFHAYATQILAQTERVSHMLRQMAALTTQNSREPELLDINDLVRATCSFITFDKRFRGIRLEQYLDTDIPAVTVVADHLTQILMNLLINAADAMDILPANHQASVKVKTQLIHGAIELIVEDNGRGMLSGVLAKAFDKSYTTKPAGKGRGIGLYLCKTLIEETGGSIALESTHMMGTTARLTIPLTLAEDNSQTDERLRA